MKPTATSSKFSLALLLISCGIVAAVSQAQTFTPVQIFVPEKMPVRIESARLVNFEDKSLLTYRLVNQSGKPLTNIGMTVSIANSGGKMQMQHMWLKDKLQVVSDYEETISIPTAVQAGSRLALSIFYAENAAGNWNADMTAVNEALRKHQISGSAVALPKAIYSKAK